MGAQEFNTVDVVRLEVETDPTGLVNMIPNPNGEFGGWGWVTPLSGSQVSGVTGDHLSYQRVSAGGSYFYSEPMPIAPGQYVAGRLVLLATSPPIGINAYTRNRFEFLDASGAVISSSAQTALVQTGTVNLSAVVAPALTAFVRLRFDMYTSGGADPAGFNAIAFNGVTVAKAATSGAFITVRTNLIPNPSFETNTTGWGAHFPALVRSNASAQVGAYSCSQSGSSGFVGMKTTVAVTALLDYTFSLYSRQTVGTSNGALRMLFRDSLGAVVGDHNITFTTTTAWTRYSMSKQAPAGAATVEVSWTCNQASTGATYYSDAFMVEQTSTLGTYFDGATPDAGGWDYAWTGTAHASTSTATFNALEYIPPVQYLNVIPESHEIRVRRNGLNVGELSATIVSAALDPADSDLIRPGRRARLTTLISGAWETVLAGKLLEADVTYELKNPNIPDEKRARIEVLILDATQTLANAKRPEGVATIDELPFVLEGAGVPWNVNGSGSQYFGTADVTTYNDGASALNQVALTRDTALGYAWMSRLGVCNAWDASEIPSGSPLVLDESDYSDLKPSFSTKACINEVTVVVQSLGVDGTTVETSYGPYRDAASIEEWGAFSKTFTVTGLDTTAVEALAAAVLAANGTPRVRVNSVTLPLTTLARVADKALTDLYDQVNVTNTLKGIDDTLRVTTIEHVIDTDGWMVTLAFADEGGVAMPVFQPPVQSGARPDVGVIELFAGPTGNIPPSKLLCDGSSKLVADYPYLFAVIGYTFGGAGASFNVPNLTDRFPIGSGTKALGTSGGAATKVLTAANLPPHAHTINHDHDLEYSAATGTGLLVPRGTSTALGPSSTGINAFNGNSGNGPGTSTAVDILNPWLSLNFVIRAV